MKDPEFELDEARMDLIAERIESGSSAEAVEDRKWLFDVLVYVMSSDADDFAAFTAALLEGAAVIKAAYAALDAAGLPRPPKTTVN